MRGNDYAVKTLFEYIAQILLHSSAESRPFVYDDIGTLRDSIDFDIEKYRKVGDAGKKCKHLIHALNDSDTFVFRTHNTCANFLPVEKIKKGSSFNGFCLSVEGKKAICISSQIQDKHRRITTILALFFNLLKNRQILYSETGDYDLARDAYEFVCEFLLYPQEIDELRATPFGWADLRTKARYFGLSTSLLNWFLYSMHNKTVYEENVRQRPESDFAKEGDDGSDGGPKYSTAFQHFIPQKIVDAVRRSDRPKVFFQNKTRKEGRAMCKKFGIAYV